MTRLATRIYEFGSFRIDTVRRLLLRDGEVVQLTPKAFDTLLALVEHTDRVLEKEELLRMVWPDTVVEERNLTVNISTLRKTLGEAATEHRYIVTLPGRGYRFAAPVRELAMHAESPPLPNQPATRARFRSMAVLPFKPLVADSRDESLEMGIADTLITRLSSLRQIIVRPVSAVRRYAGLEQDPIAAGQEQGVDVVLDGSIQKSGERVRVTVRLVSAADGRQLWAEKFEEKFTDIFSVQDAISERVAGALAVELTSEEQERLTMRYTESTDAYRFYLKGRYFASKWTEEGFKKGIEYFNKAIGLDPNYALAYDGLAYCYYNNFYLPFKESMTKGRVLAKRALEVDPGLAEARVSLGLINTWLDYDWPAAEREFRQAIELKPNYAPAHLWYGFYLMARGRSDESIAESRRAIELDPLSDEANTGLGVYLFYARRYEEAKEQLRKTLDLEPNFWFARLYLARVYTAKSEFALAIAELEKTRLIEGASTEVQSALAYVYAVAGRKDKARRIIDALKEQSKRKYVPPYNIAVVYAGLGEKERSFAYLEKEYAEGAYYMNLLKVDPELDSLRSSPQFEAFLRRLNHTPSAGGRTGVMTYH